VKQFLGALLVLFAFAERIQVSADGLTFKFFSPTPVGLK
jgi:hypothetical protein